MQARDQRRTDRSPAPTYLDIAGWRVVDVLSSDGPWHRYLAVARERAALEEDDWLASASRSRRQATAPVPTEAVELVVEASAGQGLTLSEVCVLLEEIDAPSAPVLRDIGQNEQRQAVAVLEATPGSSVEELLDRPHPLTAGEIVTILAPIAETLVELHEHGVAMGTFGCDDVRLTLAGRPVLKNWQLLTRLEQKGRPHAGALRDWRSFESLADLVLAQLPTETELPAALEREFDRCLSGEVDEGLGARLLDALFTWQDATDIQDPAAGEPGPWRAVLAEQAPGPAAGSPVMAPSADGTVGRVAGPTLLDGEDPSQARSADVVHRGDIDGLRRPFAARGRDAQFSREAASRHERRSRRRSGSRVPLLSAIRMPYRVAAVAALVMCLCAVFVGVVGSRSGGADAGSASGGSAAPAASWQTQQPHGEASPEAQMAAPPEQPAPTEEVPDWRTAAASDDPAAAAAALVGRRTECLATAAAGCLEEVYQSDAPGLPADLNRPAGAEDELVGLSVATLRDRFGDFAVVELWPQNAVQTAETPPASLTIARGEAGWRLRDVRVA
ncbi:MULTISPECIES: hypothetical protein [unclassified Pseudoclavibacter]|uniref:hypothetical protein n=1 Tax=unclassified Pseudoclavibacter TaxID=2615177 RepID=UPI001BADAF29|nr:hypothetical protein [Pseudoclavibacter sp. Marseille-Q4354]MBS3177867.1 hypothetical protein [Pseudoclavibacter sp. Marseille-Q4354]